jgi:hypothetical protein
MLYKFPNLSLLNRMDGWRVRGILHNAAWWCVVRSASLLFCFDPPLNTRSFIWRKRAFMHQPTINTKELGGWNMIVKHFMAFSWINWRVRLLRESRDSRGIEPLCFFMQRCHLHHINLIAACVIVRLYEFVASRLLSVHVEPDDFERFISSSHFTFSLELEFFCSNKIREMQKQQGQSGKRQAKNAGGAVFSEIERELGIFRGAQRKRASIIRSNLSWTKREWRLSCALAMR